MATLASSNGLAWMTPIQVIAALSAAWNSGASVQPSFLAMPMLELEDVPAVQSGKQVRFLLHRSELVFPRVNVMATLSNLVMTILAFRSRQSSQLAASKWAILAGAVACNLGATAWSLGVMAPINNQLRKYSLLVEKDPQDASAEQAYRKAIKTWKLWAIGRSVIMVGAAAAGVYATYLDALYTLPV